MMQTNKDTGHVIGATYRSNYWREVYTVKCAHSDGSVTVRWADGHETTHRTNVGRDTLLSMPA